MRFVDEVKIKVAGGKGGNGCMSFRREAHIPKGGPDGGDGGRGGSVYFEASHDVQTLIDFRYQRSYQGPDGEKGHGADCYGKKGEDIVLKVPVGTHIRSIDGVLDLDLTQVGQRALAAKGGKGGLGNIHFKSSVNRAPRESTPGEEGEHYDLQLELKLVSDIGLVGFPNAGKSTLLNALTAARSKIGNYPFTTLAPHLGVIPGDPPLIMADIPGIIEGAHQGAGLGIQFLRHISRSFALLFLISFDDEKDLERQYGSLLEEIRLYDARLLDRPRIVVVNKSDLLNATQQNAETFQAQWENFHQKVPESFLISAKEQEGLEELSAFLNSRLSDFVKMPDRLRA